MDGDFKGNLIRQALWFLRKGLEILERLFGHPPNQSASDAKPDSSGEPLVLKPSSDDEQPPRSAGLPCYNVGAGVFPTNHLSNGKEKRQLQRAERLILGSLLTNRSIGVMHVIAFHTSSGLGTISDHKRNAGTKISLIKAALRGSGATIKKKVERRWGCYQWILVRDEPKKAEFSVDVAYEIALNAQNEFDGGNYLKAMELAIQAIDTDEIVQFAHEVFCLAALEVNPADQAYMNRIRTSYRFLMSRIEQIGRGRKIGENSLSYADDEKLRDHLVEAELSLAAEYKRLSGIMTRLKDRFGAVDIEMSLADREVHEAIVALRKGGSGLDGVEKQRLQNFILVQPAVSRIFETIEKKCTKWSSASRDELRNRAKGIVLALCLDPNIPANIRLILNQTEQALRDSLRRPKTRCAEARHYKAIETATEEFLKKYGEPPTDDEIANLTGLSAEEMSDAHNWYRITYPKPPDTVDWQKSKKKPKIEDEENHGPGDAEDDEDPLAGVPA